MKNLIRSLSILAVLALAHASTGCSASATQNPAPDLPATFLGKPEGYHKLVSVETRAGDGTPVTCFILHETHDVMSCVPHK